MEQLDQEHSLELNKSLRKIQDSFDSAVGKVGSKLEAIELIKGDFEDYTIYKNKFLEVKLGKLSIYDDCFCIDLEFEPLFLKSIFSEDDDFAKWLDFANNYFSNKTFGRFQIESNVKVNQLDIEGIIQKRSQILESYLLFMKNKYIFHLSSVVVYKKIKISSLIWRSKYDVEEYIYNNILADLREGNKCDRRFASYREDREITITLEKSEGAIGLNFQNTTFQEANEYYQYIKTKIKELKEILKLRSKVTKVINNTSKILFNVMSNSESFRKQLVEKCIKIKEIFEEMMAKGEKLESKITVTFLEDLIDDITHKKVNIEQYHNITNSLKDSDMTIIEKYYKYKLHLLLKEYKDSDKEKIDRIVNIYRKMYRNFDNLRKDIEESLLNISVEYITSVSDIDELEEDIIKVFSEIAVGKSLYNRNSFHNKLYNRLKNSENNFLGSSSQKIDLWKYQIFDYSIWINNFPELFIQDILIPLFIRKVYKNKDPSSTRVIGDMSKEAMKSELNLPDCDFYNTLFNRYSDMEYIFLIKESCANISGLLISHYKNKNISQKIEVLSKYKEIWGYLETRYKERFTKEFIDPTVKGHADEIILNIGNFTGKDLSQKNREEGFIVYRHYMTDEYVDRHIHYTYVLHKKICYYRNRSITIEDIKL